MKRFLVVQHGYSEFLGGVETQLESRRLLVMVNGQVDLPGGVTPVLVDDAGDCIAVHPDLLTYGLLFRPELKSGMLEDMVMEENRETPDHIGELIAGLRAERDGFQRTQDITVAALVTALDLMRERRKPPVFCAHARESRIVNREPAGMDRRFLRD